MEFGALVKRERQKHYASARNFFARSSLDRTCTYSYYAHIESGRATPEARIATAILKELKISLRKGLTAWARDQMPDAATKAFFADHDEEAAYTGEAPSVHRAVHINRAQAKFMIANPVYWEVVLFIVSYWNRRKISAADVAKEFAMPLGKAKAILAELFEQGLVDSDDAKVFSTKEWVVIPYDKEFEALRDVNFGRAFDQFVKVKKTDAQTFRTTITRLLSPAEHKIIESKVVALTNAILALPDPEDIKSAVPTTVGVFASKRRFGHDD